MLGEYQSSHCKATGFTPAELLLGESIRTPLAVMQHQWTAEEGVNERPLGRYLVGLVEGMEEMREFARKQQESYKEQYKKDYD